MLSKFILLYITFLTSAQWCATFRHFPTAILPNMACVIMITDPCGQVALKLSLMQNSVRKEFSYTTLFTRLVKYIFLVENFYLNNQGHYYHVPMKLT